MEPLTQISYLCSPCHVLPWFPNPVPPLPLLSDWLCQMGTPESVCVATNNCTWLQLELANHIGGAHMLLIGHCGLVMTSRDPLHARTAARQGRIGPQDIIHFQESWRVFLCQTLTKGKGAPSSTQQKCTYKLQTASIIFFFEVSHQRTPVFAGSCFLTPRHAAEEQMLEYLQVFESIKEPLFSRLFLKHSLLRLLNLDERHCCSSLPPKLWSTSLALLPHGLHICLA